MTKAKSQHNIKSSVGNQYMATYAGAIGNIKCFECKMPDTQKVVGYIAITPMGKVGPLCKDYVAAALRVRNIADNSASWLAKLVGPKIR